MDIQVVITDILKPIKILKVISYQLLCSFLIPGQMFTVLNLLEVAIVAGQSELPFLFLIIAASSANILSISIWYQIFKYFVK